MPVLTCLGENNLSNNPKRPWKLLETYEYLKYVFWPRIYIDIRMTCPSDSNVWMIHLNSRVTRLWIDHTLGIQSIGSMFIFFGEGLPCAFWFYSTAETSQDSDCQSNLLVVANVFWCTSKDVLTTWAQLKLSHQLNNAWQKQPTKATKMEIHC